MPKRKVAAKHRLEYALLVAMVQFFRFWPAALDAPMQWLFTGLWLAASPRHRRLMAGNLARAFPGQSAAAGRALRRRVYRHFTRVLIDLLRTAGRRDADALLAGIDVRNGDALRRALSAGRGAIVVSAHFGNWEWLPLALSRLIGQPLTSVARPMDNPLIEDRLLRLREFLGSRIVYRQGALRRILAALDQGAPVYMLIDQNTVRREAEFVEFFGRPAATASTPAQLHLRRGVPLLPAFLVRQGRRAVVEIGEPLVFAPGGDRLADERQLTQALTSIIEEQVRRRPEQWLWFHDRWKTQPQGDCHET